MSGWDGADMLALITIFAAFLLPLFPLSWVFNRLLDSLPMALPQLGLLLLQHGVAPWMLAASQRRALVALALFSALFYAFRALSTRDLFIWTRLNLSSGLAVLWVAWAMGTAIPVLQILALTWSVPAALLTLLSAALAARLGGAYLGLVGNLVEPLPRLTASIVATALALLATFFVLFGTAMQLPLSWILPLLLLLLLWGWSCGRLFQDLLFGTYRGEVVEDLSVGSSLTIVVVLLGLLVLGLYGSGGVL
jgi:Na+/melibiose symporter-like transporter